MKDLKADVAIVGAGIVGLSHAMAAAKTGLKVVVFERNPQATGASIRNFGLIWPIGQRPGKLHERALASSRIYQELAPKAGFWLNKNGALHLAYHKDEMEVLDEFHQTASDHGYDCQLVGKDIIDKYPVIKREGLQGALLSKSELTIDPREVVTKLQGYLEKEWNVTFRFGTVVTDISVPYIYLSKEIWEINQVFICSGADFETLYPEVFVSSGITKCKLQMMKTVPQPNGWKQGPTLCAGLTLLHYEAFKHCQSLLKLHERAIVEYPDLLQWGIHVLMTQNENGELIIGDSHEYGLNPQPFDKEFINNLILRYLQSFANVPSLQISERWHGIYPKLNGQTEFISHPEKGVTIVNGLGGAGMTLSFGLAEENIRTML